MTSKISRKQNRNGTNSVVVVPHAIYRFIINKTKSENMKEIKRRNKYNRVQQNEKNRFYLYKINI